MSMQDLADAMLREIPLAQVESYVELIDVVGEFGGALEGGHGCGGGCGGGGGHACGEGCLGAIGRVGAFDVYGQSSATREDLQRALKYPEEFRIAVSRALKDSARFLDPDTRGETPSLGVRIEWRSYLRALTER